MVQVKIRSYEMIEEENREMKTMMRKLCHEMGNALTLLGGSLFYLEHELRMKESETEISRVKKDYTYICKLFNNLREYNHTEAIEKTDISIGDIVENIKDVFEKINTHSDMELSMEYPAGYSTESGGDCVYADMTKLRQVLINVLKNSAEAMEDNEENKGKNIVARISTEHVPHQSYIKSQCECGEIVSESKILHIEIRDNGKGIPERNINDIFEPMYTYGKKHGSGLGLAVVKKIIEDHRGKIKAVSAVGTGTAIHIYLPVSKICVESVC